MTDNGMDVYCTRARQDPMPGQDPNDPSLIIPWDLADDFECTTTGPVTGVVFWGSWLNDVRGKIEKIHLAIYDDIPDPDPADPCDFSMPGTELWSMDFGPGEFTETLHFTSDERGEWFWRPPFAVTPAGPFDKNIWLYHMPIDPQEAFVQRGDPCNPVIYWLNVNVLLRVKSPSDPNQYAFGWKTRETGGPMDPCHFNDDAVWSDNDGFTWNELRYPQGHPYVDESIDLSFAIVTYEQETRHTKWSQPPVEIDPNSQRPLYCGWDERSYRCDTRWRQEAKLLPSANGGHFGYSVAISGDAAVIGRPLDDASGSNCGTAYMYRYDGSSWVHEANLAPSDATEGDWFGWWVSISGDTALIGSLMDDNENGSMAGSAYVFRYNGSNWVETDKLLASDGRPHESFGKAVAVSSDAAVVGTLSFRAAYVFTPNDVDPNSWEERVKLRPSDSGGQFGISVAVSDDTALIGDAGAAYIFTPNDVDPTDWVQQAKLTPSDGAAGFGESVAICGGTAVIGAPYDDDGSNWVQDAKLLASDGTTGARFGVSVTVSNKTVLVGAPHAKNDKAERSGAVYVFRYDGSNWVQRTKLLASDGAANDYFGQSVGVSGKTAVIGADGDDDKGMEAGSAYIFKTYSEWEIVADDFRCLGPMPVTGVHWWGSYVGWRESRPPQLNPTAWRIGFWSNVADPNPGNPNDYSYPQELLWQLELPAERVRQVFAGDDYFPDPCTPSDTCFEYHAQLDASEYFWQDDYNDVTDANTFWLSIAAVYPAEVNTIEFPWGRKTRPWSWMDAAAGFSFSGNLAQGTVLDACDVTPIEYGGESYDVAFELDTGAGWVKWEQPFTGFRNQPSCGDDLKQRAVLVPTDDTTVDQYQPNYNHGSMANVIVRRGGTGYELDALLKFDISSVPVGSTIISATVGMYYWHWNDADPVGRSLRMHRITSDWNEPNTTWSNRPSYDPNVTSSSTVPASYDWMEWDVTGDVQDFVNTTYPNYGWWIRDPSGGLFPMIYFRSKDYSDADYYPYLEVEYVLAKRTAAVGPTDDTTVDQYQPNYNHGSKAYVIVRRGGTGYELDALLKFDISSIPAGVTVDAATAGLYYGHWNDANPVGRSLKMHRITKNWNESTATWNNRPSYDPNVTSSSTVPASYDWMEWDVTTDVEDFINGTQPNYGWQIRDPSGGSFPMIYFRSRDYNDANYLPYLEVKYGPAAPDTNSVSLAADDWLCDQNTPVTAAVWWGSYVGYRYQACGDDPCTRPVKPDYFELSIWDDIPDPNPGDPNTYSHPNDVIWQYKAYDYDEVLVGYDRVPGDQNAPPREPVFRYSVRLPEDGWFSQPDDTAVFWFSVVAEYQGSGPPPYDWVWTNHKHVFNDSAVAGAWDDPSDAYIWSRLSSQMGAVVDKSFVLFSLPGGAGGCLGCANYDGEPIVDFGDFAVFADDWRWSGPPGGYNPSDLDCNGFVDWWDLKMLCDQWLGSCP
jgi:hypothetical protein